MRPKRLAWITLLGLIASIALLGCGGSDDSSSDEPTAAAEDSAAETDDEAADEAAEESSEEADEEDTAPAPPTKAQYIAASDRICKESQKKGQPAFDRQLEIDKQVAKGVSLEQIEDLYHEAAKLSLERAAYRAKASVKLKALEPPASGPAKRYLKQRAATTKLLEEVAATLEKYADNPNQATTDAVNNATAAGDASAKKDKKYAKAFGFKVCGQAAKVK